MKLLYDPQGGRIGYGFNYYCPVCKNCVGASYDEQLEHPTHESCLIGKGKPIDCIHVGEKYSVPIHEVEVSKLP